MASLLEGQSNVLVAAGGLLALYLVYQVAATIHSAFFGPLSKYPGPFIRKFTVIPYALAIRRGEQHRDVARVHAKYGPVVRLGPTHVAFAGSGKTWKDIYGFRKGGSVPKDPMFYSTGFNGVHSIATTRDMADHGRQRKLFSNAFSDRALKAQEPLIKAWSTKLASKLGERAETGEKTDMLKYFNLTTFDVMADLTFGDSLNMLENSEYSRWVKTIFDGIKGGTILRTIKYLGDFPTYLVDEFLFKTKYVRARMMEHWSFTAERVDLRLARKAEKPDIWSLLENKDEEHGGLSLAHHHSNGNVFMIAGTETTATALSGTMFFLTMNPSVMAKITAEVRSIAKNGDDLTLENLARLQYLQAVLQEGLRMYPPVAIDLPRKVAAGGVEIDGNFVPEGTTIGVAQYATYRDPTNFKNPNEFHPERWLNDPEYAGDNLDCFEPFSIGPRNCLGKNLAWHEMRILLATVLLDFDFKLMPESHDWVDKQKVYTLWEKNPLWCTLSKAQR